MTKIYFEKQKIDSKCGKYCINNILQGPYFTDVLIYYKKIG